MNEKQAIAVFTRNVKGSKDKPDGLLIFAEATRVLKKKLGIKKMVELFNTSHTMINQIDKINDLNPTAQRLIRKKKLGIEQSYLLSKLEGVRQDDAAKEVMHLSSHDTRLFIDLLTKNKKLSAKEAAEKFSDSLSKKIDLLVIPMPYNIYQKLEYFSKKQKMQPHDLAYKILEKHINEKGK